MADDESFVYWLGKEVIANDIYDESKSEESESTLSTLPTHVFHKQNKGKQVKDDGDRKHRFHYDSYLHSSLL